MRNLRVKNYMEKSKLAALGHENQSSNSIESTAIDVAHKNRPRPQQWEPTINYTCFPPTILPDRTILDRLPAAPQKKRSPRAPRPPPLKLNTNATTAKFERVNSPARNQPFKLSTAAVHLRSRSATSSLKMKRILEIKKWPSFPQNRAQRPFAQNRAHEHSVLSNHRFVLPVKG